MNRFSISILMVVLISGCTSKSPEIPTQDINAIGTQIAATLISSAVQTQEVIPIPSISVTHTEAPIPSQTQIQIPTQQQIPTQTQKTTPINDPLYSDKQPGIYLVNVDIAPGVWRSLGNSDNCVWYITDRKGETLNMFAGMTGGTIFIDPSAFQVELREECGVWKFLEKP